MALNKSFLYSNLKSIQDNHPTSIVDAANVWANAIFNYSSAGMSLDAIPVLDVSFLMSSFLTSMTSMTFMDDLGNNLLQFWLLAVWTSVNFSGTTIPIPPLDSASLGKRILNGEDASTILSNEIDLWTKTIQVTLINTSSGASTSAPVI